ncbi:Os03g0795800 protein, related [Neospora caninum Liverpool]|uniref:Os03g0795800 protein, related n=1 Tax=Neospora caninum (strain Liverpool) TaxID=572307 RepID=F0VMK8_NEOCL|nr:Os03g0795800 protein, related [Neospora caninum Liverpool]CBZ54954.1 Os03g0795800 protein, related [Neospora caninum Liverpool]CEL69676.1 TPA: Os03g0795800 protein, related [Neospora caninum Liverpool]|eukprot:XP_003884982.1 Os03g0795800 protein, related [Neospora caninum Liverpool]
MDTKSENSVATGVGPAPAGRMPSYYDPEIGGAARTAQEEIDERIFTKEIRQGFIRKVYTIIALQLITTAAVTALFLFVDPVRAWFLTHGQPVIIAAGVVLLVTSIPLVCCEGASRRFPFNYLLLCVFTLAESVLVAAVTAHYSEKTVLIAVAGTAVITVGLSLFACQVKYDFTSWVGVLFIFALNLMIFGLFCIFLPKWAQVLYSSLALLLFSIYLVVDTQLIVGRGKLRLSEDDYIVAALMIYVDIITIFLHLLRLVASATDNN